MAIESRITKPQLITAIFFLGCLAYHPLVIAETYQTAFGFQVELPEEWIMLNRQTLRAEFEGQDLDTLGLTAAFANEEEAENIFSGIQEGRYQYFFNKASNSPNSVEFIGLRLAPRESGPPEGLSSLLCFQVERDLPEFLGQPAEVAHCDYDITSNVEFLNYSYRIDGNSSLEYQFEYYLSDNLVLLLTGASLADSESEFESVIDQFSASITDYFSAFPVAIEEFTREYDNENFLVAKEKLDDLAEFGDHEAEYRIGVLYENGEGVAVNYELAREYYDRSAAKGNITATTALAGLYYRGQGVTRDLERASQLYAIASQAGMPLAQRSYATMLMRGEGVEQSTAEALDWFMAAARQGDVESGQFLADLYMSESEAGSVEALRMLAALYLEGAGVDTDIERGLEYLRQAARSGSETAKDLLGAIYSQGRYGIEIDLEVADSWRNLQN